MQVNASRPIKQMPSHSARLPAAQVALLALGLMIAIGRTALGSSAGTRPAISDGHTPPPQDASRLNLSGGQQILDEQPIEQQLLQLNSNELPPPNKEVELVDAFDSQKQATPSTEPKKLKKHKQQQKEKKLAKSAQISGPRNRCILAERELDRCSARLIGLGRSGSLVYPDSMAALDSVYCPKFRESVACIKNNTDCYKPFERQIISWILSSTKKMNYKRCKSDNEKIRFLRLTSSACFAQMRDPMDDCMGRYIGQLDAVAEFGRESGRLTESDRQIQLACCANHRFKQCIMRGARQGCQSSHDHLKKLRRTSSLSSQRAARRQMARQLQDTMEDLKSTLDEMALTGPEFICNAVDEKFCRLHFDGRYANRLARHRSIVPAMIRIYANK